MTDIVERLRTENTLTGYYDPPQLQEEAAAEIERLRGRVAIYEIDTTAAEYEIDRLRAALQTAVAVIENYDREVITDTIWLNSNETLVDYLRSAGGQP